MIHIKQFVHNHFISSRIFEKMSLYTVASRLVDGLPLFASTDAGGHETEMMQAKELIKRIDASSPSKMTLDSGPYSLRCAACRCHAGTTPFTGGCSYVRRRRRLLWSLHTSAYAFVEDQWSVTSRSPSK